VIVAGGVESMTHAPYVLPKSPTPFPAGHTELYLFSSKRKVYDGIVATRVPIRYASFIHGRAAPQVRAVHWATPTSAVAATAALPGGMEAHGTLTGWRVRAAGSWRSPSLECGPAP
jgi:hypothetical protein